MNSRVETSLRACMLPAASELIQIYPNCDILQVVSFLPSSQSSEEQR